MPVARGADGLREAVLRGLSIRPKRTPPFLLYDRLGSILFDAICEVPEYYL
ncbi:MAG: L-histidine N(alpha)-methyltransferase, partial [Acidobacteria bacterium]|nr:L-histidine N(alpha)-methyltransferase [Acidobacteriota bacterium]